MLRSGLNSLNTIHASLFVIWFHECFSGIKQHVCPLGRSHLATSHSHRGQQPLPDKVPRVPTRLTVLRHEQLISRIYPGWGVKRSVLAALSQRKTRRGAPREIALSFIHTSNTDAASGTARDSGTGMFVKPSAYDKSSGERLI